MHQRAHLRQLTVVRQKSSIEPQDRKRVRDICDEHGIAGHASGERGVPLLVREGVTGLR